MSRRAFSLFSRFLGIGCAAAALATAVIPASAQDEKVQITFFIWAGSNQGVIPMEIIE